MTRQRSDDLIHWSDHHEALLRSCALRVLRRYGLGSIVEPMDLMQAAWYEALRRRPEHCLTGTAGYVKQIQTRWCLYILTGITSYKARQLESLPIREYDCDVYGINIESDQRGPLSLVIEREQLLLEKRP